ncbi:MAG: Ig-like domain repeat protein [Acidobacteriaceae bacterium]|nr:Ig-like domain repeat protein [Acidobacteriaceae bacterium]
MRAKSIYGNSLWIACLLVGIATMGLMTGCSSTTPVDSRPATTTSLAVSPDQAASGAPVTLTATVSGNGTATGLVTFLEGSTALGIPVELVDGVATMQISTLTANTTHQITAFYTGDTANAGSTSAAVSVAISGIASTTSLTASPSQAAPGAPVTLTAAVSSTSPVTGTVTFMDGSSALGDPVPLVNGSATMQVTTLAASTTHQITAVYSGDASCAGSTSAAVPVTISDPVIISANATFDLTASNQTIFGFGAAVNFDFNYLLNSTYRSEITDALWGPANGLGLTFLRIRNQFDNTKTNFDNNTSQIVDAANTAHGAPLTLLMTSYSPPAYLKSNDSANGCTSADTNASGGCIRNVGTLSQAAGGGYDYAGFAQYWSKALAAYALQTPPVVPEYISIQNEPDWAATYASCRFNPTEATYNGTNYAGYNLAFDAVYNELQQAMPNPPKMLAPENNTVDTRFLDFVGALNNLSEVDGLAHHLYNVCAKCQTDGNGADIGQNPDTGVTALTNMNNTYSSMLKFQTEYYATPGFYAAWNIHNALVYGNDNAYFYWAAFWPGTLTADNTQAADQQGLLYVDNPANDPSTWAFPHGWAYNDSYYALKHYSFFVQPGYVRYNATVDNPDERVSVYQSPDQKTTVIVAINTSTSTADGLALDLSGISYTSSVMYRSTFSENISSGERWNNLGPYVSEGVNLPPQSVVTIVLTN